MSTKFAAHVSYMRMFLTAFELHFVSFLVPGPGCTGVFGFGDMVSMPCRCDALKTIVNAGIEVSLSFVALLHVFALSIYHIVVCC